MDEKQLKESIASLVKDKTQREALAQILVEWIEPVHITQDFVGMLLDTRALNPGDILVKKVRKGLKVFSHVPGSVPMKGEITISERMNFAMDFSVIGAQANLWELEQGQIGTMESIRQEMMLKLRDYYMNKVFTALTSVWTLVNTPTNYTSVAGHITGAALKAGIDYINQQIPGGAKAIVGIRSLLTPITLFGGFWNDGVTPTYWGNDTAINEIMTTGWLGKFYGVPIIALDQQWDNPEDRNALLPTDKILIVGQHVGEFITYGPPTTKEWTDMRPTPPYWNVDISQQYAFMVDKCEGIYVFGNVT
jgi:hypothetical protein